MSAVAKVIQLENKLREIFKSRGAISNIKIEAPGAQEGYVSVPKYITVTFQTGEQLDLFIKLKADSDSHNEVVNEMKAFEKESVFFEKFIPAAKALCVSKGLPEFLDFYPKCYYADEKMCLLENLVVGKQYETKDKKKMLAFPFAK